MFICAISYGADYEVIPEKANIYNGDTISGELSKGTTFSSNIVEGDWVYFELTVSGVTIKGWIQKNDLLPIQRSSEAETNEQSKAVKSPRPEPVDYLEKATNTGAHKRRQKFIGFFKGKKDNEIGQYDPVTLTPDMYEIVSSYKLLMEIKWKPINETIHNIGKTSSADGFIVKRTKYIENTYDRVIPERTTYKTVTTNHSYYFSGRHTGTINSTNLTENPLNYTGRHTGSINGTSQTEVPIYHPAHTVTERYYMLELHIDFIKFK